MIQEILTRKYTSLSRKYTLLTRKSTSLDKKSTSLDRKSTSKFEVDFLARKSRGYEIFLLVQKGDDFFSHHKGLLSY